MKGEVIQFGIRKAEFGIIRGDASRHLKISLHVGSGAISNRRGATPISTGSRLPVTDYCAKQHRFSKSGLAVHPFLLKSWYIDYQNTLLFPTGCQPPCSFSKSEQCVIIDINKSPYSNFSDQWGRSGSVRVRVQVPSSVHLYGGGETGRRASEDNGLCFFVISSLNRKGRAEKHRRCGSESRGDI